MTTAFTGFPEEALDFYEGLEADNTRTYWERHRQTYSSCVREPMQALLDELGPEFGAAKFYRPYRDLRYTRDKTPYKTHAGAAIEPDPSHGGALYVQLSADGLLVAGGYYRMAPDQLERYRAVVDDNRKGRQLEGVLADLEAAGFHRDGDRLRTKPAGFPGDHPRIELLRHRTLVASRWWPPEPWLHTAEVLDRVRESWRALAPFNRWLDRQVGASRLPPDRKP